MNYSHEDLRSMIELAFSKVKESEKRFLDCEKAYRAKADTYSKNKRKRKNNNTNSHLCVPLIKTTVQILHSIFQTSFMSKCPIDIDRVGERENDGAIRNALMAIVKQAWEKSSHRIGLSKSVLSAISLPLGIAALFWDKKTNSIKTRFIPIGDMAFDPDAFDISDIEYACYRSKISVREIKENFDSKFYKNSENYLSRLGERRDNERLKKDEIYVKANDKDGNYWSLTTFVDGNVVRDNVRFYELPFHFGYLMEDLPSVNDDERENETHVYGYSVPEFLYELQKEYNIKRNQKIDIVEKIIRPPRTIDSTAGGVALTDIETGSDYIRVKTDQGKKVQDVIGVDYVPSSYPLSEEIGLLQKEYEIASGINSVMTGQTSPSDRRAMGALQTVNASSSMRIESMMQTLVNTMLKRYSEHFVKLVYYNTSDDEIIQITENPEIINIIGRLGQRVPLEFNVRINFGTIISDEIKFGKLTQLLQVLTQSGVANPAITEKLIQDIMVIIQGENAATENVQIVPPEPSPEDIERESLAMGEL